MWFLRSNQGRCGQKAFGFSFLTPTSTTPEHQAVSAGAAWVWSVQSKWSQPSRVKREGDRPYSTTLCLTEVHITDLSVRTLNSARLGLCSSYRQWSIVAVRVSLWLNGDHRGDDDIEVGRIKIVSETLDNRLSRAHEVLYVHQHFWVTWTRCQEHITHYTHIQQDLHKLTNPMNKTQQYHMLWTQFVTSLFISTPLDSLFYISSPTYISFCFLLSFSSGSLITLPYSFSTSSLSGH